MREQFTHSRCLARVGLAGEAETLFWWERATARSPEGGAPRALALASPGWASAGGAHPKQCLRFPSQRIPDSAREA